MQHLCHSVQKINFYQSVDISSHALHSILPDVDPLHHRQETSIASLELSNKTKAVQHKNSSFMESWPDQLLQVGQSICLAFALMSVLGATDPVVGLHPELAHRPCSGTSVEDGG